MVKAHLAATSEQRDICFPVLSLSPLLQPLTPTPIPKCSGENNSRVIENFFLDRDKLSPTLLRPSKSWKGASPFSSNRCIVSTWEAEATEEPKESLVGLPAFSVGHWPVLQNICPSEVSCELVCPGIWSPPLICNGSAGNARSSAACHEAQIGKAQLRYSTFSSSPPKFLGPLCIHFSPPTLFPWQPLIWFLKLEFAFSRTLYRRNHKIGTCFCSWLCTLSPVLWDSFTLGASAVHPLCGRVVFHRTDVLQVAFVSWWKFRLFPGFGYCKKSCCGQSQSLCVCIFSFLLGEYLIKFLRYLSSNGKVHFICLCDCQAVTRWLLPFSFLWVSLK